jgi:hypothetical protein
MTRVGARGVAARTLPLAPLGESDLWSDLIGPSDPRNRGGWIAAGVFTSRGGPGEGALFVTGHSISLILRVEPADNRSGRVCHGGVGRSRDRSIGSLAHCVIAQPSPPGEKLLPRAGRDTTKTHRLAVAGPEPRLRPPRSLINTRRPGRSNLRRRGPTSGWLTIQTLPNSKEDSWVSLLSCSRTEAPVHHADS